MRKYFLLFVLLGFKSVVHGQDQSGALLRMEYYYENSMPSGINASRVDGRSTGYRWQYMTDSLVQGYGMSYDGSNRLTKATFKDYSMGTNCPPRDYTMMIREYDAAGNILGIDRKGFNSSTGSWGPIDQISSKYIAGQLYVSNDGTDYQGKYDFGDKGTVTSFASVTEDNLSNAEYTYDSWGRMTEDKNRKLTISYNAIGKPSLMMIAGEGSIRLTYTMDGQLLRRTITKIDGSVTKYDYVGGAVYKNDSLEYISTLSGKVIYNHDDRAENGGWYSEQELYLSDKEGQTRLAIVDKNRNGQVDMDNGEVTQVNSYYPWGLQHEGVRQGSGSDNKWIGGAEKWQELAGMNLYQYGARQYDPQIGRFTSIDPLAELTPKHSAYSYALNDPYNFNDYSGLTPVPNGTGPGDPPPPPNYVQNWEWEGGEWRNYRTDNFNGYWTADGDYFMGNNILREVEIIGDKPNWMAAGYSSRADWISHMDRQWPAPFNPTANPAAWDYGCRTEAKHYQKQDFGRSGGAATIAKKFQDASKASVSQLNQWLSQLSRISVSTDVQMNSFVRFDVGLQSIKDDGIKGVTLKAPTLTVFEAGLGYSIKNGLLTEGNNRRYNLLSAIANGEDLRGGLYEVSVETGKQDVKFNKTLILENEGKYSIFSKEFYKQNMIAKENVSVGSPWKELLKVTKEPGAIILSSGLQEDWGRSFYYIAGLKLDLRFQGVIKIEF